MTLLKLACFFVITWTCHASSIPASGDFEGPYDYESVMKIVERLEKRVEVVEMLERRVEALEAENNQQRSEITELKAAMQQKQEQHKEDSAETDDEPVAESNSYAAGHQENRIRRSIPELTIAFYAALQTEVHHLGQGQNIRFDNVVTNVGNAYDSHLGAFKAPVAGVYVFSTTVLTYNRDTTHYALALNGQPITVLFVHGAESAFDNDSQTIILQLKPGDDVSVQHTQTDMGLPGSNHSVFSGFLLSMTDDGSVSIVG